MDHCYNQLFSKEHIETAIENLGKQITRDYANKNLIVLALAEGGLMFAMDLIRKIDLPLEYYTVIAKSYGNGMKSGKLKIIYFPKNINWTDKEVLIIDDICDSGKTIKGLKKYIKKISNNNDINIKSAVLIKNEAAKECVSASDYIGFYSHGEWLVGYGLDDAQKYRNLDFVGYKVIKGE